MADTERKPSRVPPHLVAALVCDTSATDPSTGKKSLIGVFTTLFSSIFPTSRALTLYLKVADGEGFYPLKIQFLRSEDERVLAEAEGDVTCPARTQAVDFLVPFPPLVFEEPGRHEFRILMSEMYVGRAVLDAHKLQVNP
jgi:hypothetical protein